MRPSLLLVLAVVLLGCGAPVPRCQTGCVNVAGQCEGGTSTLACGTGGLTCSACGLGQQCSLGQCMAQTTGGGAGGGGGGGVVDSGTGGGTTGGGAGDGADGGSTGGGTGGGGSSACTDCAGCCDADGTCAPGNTTASCGSLGNVCEACAINQLCENGACVFSGIDGGTDGGTDGGGTSSFCSAATCPSGCCTSDGVCITNTSPARCGAGGNVCQSCQAGSTCESGSCAPCNGCIDIATGTCLAGSTLGSCGGSGNFCQACGSGQTCTSGSCSNLPVCNTSNCAGCCSGNTCIQCSTQPPDAGVTPDGGGGIPIINCRTGSDCGPNSCCNYMAFLDLGICLSAGEACPFGGVCNPWTLVCH